MILVPTKTSSNENSPLQIAPTKEKSTALSFADLLKGVGYKKDAQSSAFEKSHAKQEQLKADPKAEVKTDIKKDTFLSLLKNEPAEQPLEVNPKLSQMLGKEGMKVLIDDAKKYLQTQITESEGYKRAEIKTIPKTLKGLVKVAKELGVDVSKITIEELKNDNKQQLYNLNNNGKNQAGLKDLLNTPLFKAQESLAGTSTQQIVQIKQQKLEEKPQNQKTNDPLRLLLRGESVSANETALSLEATKVLATSKTEEKVPSRTLESLLRSETSESSKNTDAVFKTDSAHKAESLDVKINEAKQMVKYLSNDVKNAIDDYKSPFTRVRIQLNPQNMGEMDLTIVQRGNNLHVNLSSNNAAINTLVLHANELRQQLQNSGINNATLNFNNQSESGANHSHQEQRQQEQRGHKTYESLAEAEAGEEILSSLEIIVPRYI
ncbi:MAG: flagellar hook-length control protein FliK [Sulfurimonadaceae bacterium]|jgi:flagellar hook-length control protein FliK|nr:flagellar hook-length control protein FliK [Sulfurimonadaceae bacterium]